MNAQEAIRFLARGATGHRPTPELEQAVAVLEAAVSGSFLGGMEYAAQACDEASGLLTGEKAINLHMMAKQLRLLARKASAA
jgi:hypothetical protein